MVFSPAMQGGECRMKKWTRISDLPTEGRTASDGGLYQNPDGSAPKSSGYRVPRHEGQDVPEHWFTLLKIDGTEASVKFFAVCGGHGYEEMVVVQEDPENDGPLFIAQRMKNDQRARYEQRQDLEVPQELLANA